MELGEKKKVTERKIPAKLMLSSERGVETELVELTHSLPMFPVPSPNLLLLPQQLQHGMGQKIGQ